MDQLPLPSCVCLWRNPASNLSCQRIFINSETLLTHTFNDHLHHLQPFILDGKKRWPCRWSNCDKTYNKKVDLDNHLSQHKNDFGISEYACNVCQPKQIFNTAIKLQDHKEQIHTLDDDSNLESRNAQFAEPVLPPRRSQPPPHPPTFQRHISDLPAQTPGSSSTTSSCEWIVDGKTCDQAQSPQDLLQHVSSAHLVHRSQVSTNWMCLWRDCTSVYTKRPLLITHLARSHLHIPLHFCSACQIEFPTPAALSLHRRNHDIIDHQHHLNEKLSSPSCQFCQKKLDTSPSTQPSSSTPTSSDSTPSTAVAAAPPPLQTSYRAMPSQAGPLSSSSSSSFARVPYARSYYSK